MPLSIAQTTAPTVEPLTFDEVKPYIRVSDDTERPFIENILIKSAREYVETYTKRQLITATWRLRLPAFPPYIVLPRPTLQAVSSITYVDNAGAAQTVTAADYTYDVSEEPAIVRLAYGDSWPTHRGGAEDYVAVTYTAGYGATSASIPAGIKLAMLLLISHGYDQRSPIVIGTISQDVDLTVAAQLSRFRVGWEW
ncbi:MAG TPA: hypothetical protein VMY42_17985 [Thermoguttaceae bacterium]|nr:hypothetical protein [Thermoguttaceae bacterium]